MNIMEFRRIFTNLYHPGSLRLRLTALVLAITLSVLLAATAYIGTRAINIIELTSNERLNAANHTLAATVSVWLESPLNAMRNLVSLPDISSMKAERQRPFLQKMSAAYPYMYLISTTDLKGMNVARNDNEQPKDYSDRIWFQKAREGEPVAFESLIGKTIGRPALVVSVPIKNEAGRVVGVGMFAADLAHLAQRVQATQIGKTGVAYVVDRQNRVIAHPDAAYASELLDLSAYPPVAALRKGVLGPVDFSDEAGQRWRAYVDMLDNGWGVVVQQREEELLSTRRLFQHVALAIIFGAVLVLMCTTWWVVRGALQPVKVLTEAVTDVTSDNFSLPDFKAVRLPSLNIRTGDEVGTLAESFQKMAVRLQATLASLEQELAERKHTEASLRESEEKFRSLVDNLDVGVYRNTGPHGRFIQANPAMVKIFGFDSLEEFMNVSVSDLYQNPDDRRLFVEEVSCNGSIKDRELALKKKDGTPIWTSVSASIKYDEKGEIKWLYGVIEDITERKKLEEQLRQAQKMEAIGTLAGGVAHDFNNILTAIIGYASLVRLRMDESNPLRIYIDDILTSSEKAAKLTQSLLAFSRKQIISPKLVNLNEIVKRIDKLLLRVIGEDIEFKTILDHGELTVMADSGQIEQVLMNLATNARDAMPDGGILTIKTERVEIFGLHSYIKPGAYAVVSVSDTGKGMDEMTKQRIFEPFFTTKELGKGTGLGLSIVYGIIKQHNGEINVYSEPGRGTTFKIYLKLVAAKSVSAEAAPLPPLIGGTETLLIAEDDNDVRGLMKNILREFGYTVIEAVDGEDAVTKFVENKDKIKLLILDVVMPKKNGKEAYEEIRKLNGDIRVLFSSGYTSDIIHQKGILDEGVNFISKPVTPHLLLSKVREALTR